VETFIVSLVGALAAGAVAAAKESASQAIKDAYRGIRKYLADRYTTVPMVELEKDPQSKGRRLVVQETFEKEQARIETDEALPKLAATLIDSLKADAPEAAKQAGVVLEDIRAGIDVQIRRLATGTIVRNIETRTGSVVIEDIGNQPKK